MNVGDLSRMAEFVRFIKEEVYERKNAHDHGGQSAVNNSPAYRNVDVDDPVLENCINDGTRDGDYGNRHQHGMCDIRHTVERYRAVASEIIDDLCRRPYREAREHPTQALASRGRALDIRTEQNERRAR